MKPTPIDTFPKLFHPEEREAHTGKNEDVIRWRLCYASQRRTFRPQGSCTLTVLPASPDKAAVLLLLARNECVGVSSLLTTLLSQGLSCRRRAKRHHISKRLEAFLPGARGCRASHLSLPHAGLRERRALWRGQWVKSQGNRNLPKGAVILEHCLSSKVPFVAGSILVLWMQFLLTTLLQQSTDNTTEMLFPRQAWHVSPTPVIPICRLPLSDGQWTAGTPQPKGFLSTLNNQLHQRPCQLNARPDL